MMNVAVLFMADQSTTTKRFNKNELEAAGLENVEEKKKEKRNKFHIFQMDDSGSGSSNNSSRSVLQSTLRLNSTLNISCFFILKLKFKLFILLTLNTF
jgi:hypothetical protein